MFWIVSSINPFSEKALNIANCFTELGLSVIFPVMALYLFDISEVSKDTVDLILVIFINAIVSVQMTASVFIFIKTVRLKIRDCKKSKVNPGNQNDIKMNAVEIEESKSLDIEHPGVKNSLASIRSFEHENFSSFMQKVDYSSRPNLYV